MHTTFLAIVDLSFHSIDLLAKTRSGEGEFSPFSFLLSIAAYVFGAFCLQKIFQRLSIPDDWLAWIPIANTWLMYKAGDQSPWWIIGLFIPLVNLVAVIFLIIAFVNIIKKLGKSPWLALLMLIPIANLWLMYHLAFN